MNLMRLYSLGLGPNELVIDIYKALPLLETERIQRLQIINIKLLILGRDTP